MLSLQIVNDDMVKIGTLGGLGYLLQLVVAVVYVIPILATAEMGLGAEVGVFVISLVTVIMLALAWYMLGCRLQDGLMKLYGILSIGWLILTVATTIGLVVIVETLVGTLGTPEWSTGTLALISILFLMPVGVGLLFAVWHKVDSGLMKTIVMGLLGLFVISSPLLFVELVGALLLIISFIGLFVITIALEIRNLFAAGSKLEEGCFGFAGWLKLGVAILSLVGYLLIASIAAIGFTPGTISQVSGMTETAKWIAIGSMILVIMANILAGIAFLKAKIPRGMNLKSVYFLRKATSR